MSILYINKNTLMIHFNVKNCHVPITERIIGW